MAVKLSPIWVGIQFFNSAGNVLAGGQIFQYLAGTTTPASTFTDSTGSTPNANPITLDSAGRYSNQIWMTVGTTYKLVLKDSGGTTILTEDNITGVNDTSSGAASEWILQGTPTYVSGTSFTVNGNQTTVFQVGRRVQAQINSGFIYGTITSSTFSSVTTVVIVPDSGALDATLSSVSVGLLGETNPSVPSTIAYALTLSSQSSTYSGALRIGTNPNQPAYRAHRTTNQTSGTTAIFDTIDNQNGSGYSNSTGVFTAPVTGWYLLSANINIQNSSGGAVSVTYNIVANSVNVATYTIASLPNGGTQAVSLNAICFLSATNTASIVGNSAFTATILMVGGAAGSVGLSDFYGAMLY